MKYIGVIILFMLLRSFSFATTWDEPWQSKIYSEADYFILAEVDKVDSFGVKVKLLESFWGEFPKEIMIDNFFLLDLQSASNNGHIDFNFKSGQLCYFFLKKGENGNYQLPTPTSGADYLEEGYVYGALRHTYHVAKLRQDHYELFLRSIWNYNKDIPYIETGVLDTVTRYLECSVAGFEEDEIDTFFIQHACLESVFHLKLDTDFKSLRRFATSDNFHAQVSAIRAMRSCSDPKVEPFLLNYLAREDIGNFTKVIAIWVLWSKGDEKVLHKLWSIKELLSDEVEGFGGNIMDPRIGTHFPSPRRAVVLLRGGASAPF